MSRSRREPWVVDPHSDMKKIHSRRMRRKVKQILWEFCKTMAHEAVRSYLSLNNERIFVVGPEPEIPVKNEVTNPYDIVDWKSYCDEPEYRRK